MFSLEKFYNLLDKNLFESADIGYFYFSRFGSLLPEDFSKGVDELKSNRIVLFYDQEPVYQKDVDYLLSSLDNERITFFNQLVRDTTVEDRVLVFANSEISKEKDLILDNYQFRDWYYFFHGFAALDWYRDVQYQPPIRNFSKVFICFNNLYTEKRSYRLNLVARLLEKNLNGYISLPATTEKIKQEIFNPNSMLSTESKKIILEQLLPKPPKLIIDHEHVHGALSADLDLSVTAQGLFHVVTETIFYDQKLHLTEKVFKPIVSQRPFFLVGAPGNLAYLKTYGFKTFDRWIDESYDTEEDSDLRISKIVAELERLCQLDRAELDKIYQEMLPILEHNFNWFFNEFRPILVKEMINNFENQVCTVGNADQVGKRLSS